MSARAAPHHGLQALAACAAPTPPPPPSAPGSGDRPNLRSAVPEEAAPTPEQITKRCLDYGYERDKPEWADCVRLQERDFLLRPKLFVWPGQTPGG